MTRSRLVSVWLAIAALGCTTALSMVVVSPTPARAAGPDPSVVGQWGPVVNWPIVAVHSSLLPSGRVLTWEAWELPGAIPRVYDPVAGTFTAVPVSAGI